MMRIIRLFLGLALIAFIGYLFFSGHIAGAIIAIMASIILIPLAMHMTNGGLYFGHSSHDSTSTTSGGVDGGMGASGGGDGCL